MGEDDRFYLVPQPLEGESGQPVPLDVRNRAAFKRTLEGLRSNAGGSDWGPPFAKVAGLLEQGGRRYDRSAAVIVYDGGTKGDSIMWKFGNQRRIQDTSLELIHTIGSEDWGNPSPALSQEVCPQNWSMFRSCNVSPARLLLESIHTTV